MTDLLGETMLVELIIKLNKTKVMAYGRQHALANVISDRSHSMLEMPVALVLLKKSDEQELMDGRLNGLGSIAKGAWWE